MDSFQQIRFGTSGWRAIIADEFTFENVRLVTQAIADYLKTKSSSCKVIIGYDTRFLSDKFAEACAQVLAANKIRVLLTQRDTPTPVIAYQIINKHLDGGINFTASHNPPEYNGIKFSPSYGGPATKEVTAAIEENIKKLQKNLRNIKTGSADNALIKMFDPQKEYIAKIKRLVNLTVIKKARLKIAVDCMHGTSRGYLDEILKDACRGGVVLNNNLNPLFGGFPPEPDKSYLNQLVGLVKNDKFHLGLACDGDADRFGIIDKKGIFLSPNQVFTLLFHYLLKTRGKAKKVARTQATTHMIDAIAEKEGIEVVETPVGFKYIGEALSKGDCLIGGEESGGLSIQGHVPEKDGILACLLVAEMVAKEKKPCFEILKTLYKKYGYFYSKRIDLHLEQSNKDILLERLKTLSKKGAFGQIKIKRKDLSDGFKIVFADNYWVMFRVSGTEPVVRCYLEADSSKKLFQLVGLTKRLLEL